MHVHSCLVFLGVCVSLMTVTLNLLLVVSFSDYLIVTLLQVVLPMGSTPISLLGSMAVPVRRRRVPPQAHRTKQGSRGDVVTGIERRRNPTSVLH